MKRNCFKTAAVMLAMIMLIFTGCNNDMREETNPNGDMQSPVSQTTSASSLSLMLSENDATAWLLVKLAREKYPQIAIEIIDEKYYGLSSEADFLKKIAGEIMAGKGPDIISPKVFKNLNNAVQNGVFENLTPYLLEDKNYNKSDYSNAIIAGSIFDREQLFIPTDIQIPLYITTSEFEQKYNFKEKNLYEIVDIHDANNIKGNPYEHKYEPLFINDYQTKTTGLSEPAFIEFLKQRRNLSAQVKVFNNTIVPFEKNPLIYVPGISNINTVATMITHTNDTPIVLPALDEQGEFTAYLNGLGINANSDQKQNAYKFLSLAFTMATDIDIVKQNAKQHSDFMSEISRNAYSLYANKLMQKRCYDEILIMYKSGTIYSAENSIIDSSKLKFNELIEQYLPFYDQLDRCLYSADFRYTKELSDYIHNKTELSDDKLLNLVKNEADKATVAISE